MTESKKPSAGVVRPVLDPDAELSDATRRDLRLALEDHRGDVGRPANPLWAAVPLLPRGGAGVAAAAVLSWWTEGLEVAGSAADRSTLAGMLGRKVQEGLDLVHGLLALWPVAGGFVTLVCAGLVADRALYNRQLRRLAAAQQHVVHPRDLTDDARDLLARAQLAMTAVLDSTVHREHWLDAPRNVAAFPRQEWAIARGLRDYSRVARKDHRVLLETDSSAVAELLTSRRGVLATSLHGIERRVAALEAYASQVAEADARFAEVRKLERLAEGRDELLDLLARTAADDLVVAEIDALTGEAAVVAATFSKALESAREAASAALPLQGAE
ncbi:hypothetical protein [Streptomyces sp. H036]|uniref:hypothetical protein n=1 Tax=Streptomyces sp. H036 TaxID=1519487 RepID=UPI0006ADFBFF|nr:hypothetical protein [Streptomyces sp. H036]KOV41911.1 hypothetical protein ADK98_25310 [Streptomyces sp. H036]